MTELRLDVHGISVLLACDHPVVLESLRRDFAYFEAGPADTRPHIRWTLHADGARRIAEPARRAAFHMRDFAVFDEGSTRFVRYEDGALAVYDYGARSGHLYCGDPERLHELSYLAVLSRVGEDLDRRKLHRLHALGFEYKGWAGFILLPSGGGKSTLALELIRSSGLGIVSEDTPILSHQMRARAFPLRWGFAPSVDLSSVPKELIRLFRRKRHGLKQLVDVDFFRSRVRDDLPVRWLLLGRREPSAEPRIEPSGRPAAFGALFVHLVVGHGVAQMSEYMLRFSLRGMWDLLRIAASRLGAGARLLQTTRPHLFVMGSDPRGNLRVLQAFLDSA